MSKSVFFSFHYRQDHARAQLVRNMNKFTTQEELSPQRWESVKASGSEAVHRWIAREMAGKDAVVVLVGSQTASRPWVLHEIRHAWDHGIPLLGVRVHGLSAFGATDRRGDDPFARIRLTDGSSLDSRVDLHVPAGTDSRQRYNAVAANLEGWVAAARRRRV